MAFRALTAVLLGQSPSAQPGDIIPDTFSDMAGNPVPVDFERLVELGAAEADSPADPPAEDSVSGLTRDELNARAAGAGVSDPEKLANKQAVIDAIAEATP